MDGRSQGLTPRRLVRRRWVRNELESSRRKVLGALTAGRFKASDLLYYFDGVDHLQDRYGDPYQRLTPGTIPWRKDRPKTK